MNRTAWDNIAGPAVFAATFAAIALMLYAAYHVGYSAGWRDCDATTQQVGE